MNFIKPTDAQLGMHLLMQIKKNSCITKTQTLNKYHYEVTPVLEELERGGCLTFYKDRNFYSVKLTEKGKTIISTHQGNKMVEFRNCNHNDLRIKDCTKFAEVLGGIDNITSLLKIQ